ncbi:pf08747 domain protein [Leptolyngbya sp. Heron Island J]|uniref:BREX protein BrxB domain-containing protein n=1 Tax=Leptolyngbya sp. Heron Island J TaxID=1385935 RepID=UPI0003B9AC33|nr:BREX protein BrxB domain-containing protein [Leptolyngbya sp. Heron Island J]ESA32466.1 pf08747 domain protein [Leptolyngbya sp. Heron Island J]
MTNGSLFETASLDRAVHDLKKDLLDEAGPRISTMRNYRFAILTYDPRHEFKLRQRIRSLSDELTALGWHVDSISLLQLLLNRLKSEDPWVLESIIDMEKYLHEQEPELGLNHLKDKLTNYIEGPDGIAKDVVAWIDDFAEKNPNQANHTLIFLGRTGALYPFFRSSALLKHIDGKTQNLPVVVLYPGSRNDLQSLSFMEELEADRDYRPRVYS